MYVNLILTAVTFGVNGISLNLQIH